VGNGRVNVAVVDSGPLIHLAEINALRLLQLFARLYIPDAVWSETVDARRIGQADLVRLGNVQRVTLPSDELGPFVQKNNLGALQLGERECLWLCQKNNVSTLLTDDLAVRDTAKRLNLIPVGSLGIVVKAFRMRQISLAEAEHSIADLDQSSSLFVTRAIVELAIVQLHQSKN